MVIKVEDSLHDDSTLMQQVTYDSVEQISSEDEKHINLAKLDDSLQSIRVLEHLKREKSKVMEAEG